MPDFYNLVTTLSRYAKLAKDQENRPVMIEELFRVSAYMHNGSINILPGITKNGLKFSTMLNKDGYKNSFGLDAVSLELINEYRKLRNMIHLPGDPIDTLRLSCMSWQDKIEFIHSYIDKYIVSINRKIVAEWGLHKTLGIEKW